MMDSDTGDSPRNSAFLDALTPEDRSELLALGHTRDYKAGTTIFMRGDPGDTLYVIEEGRVEISLTSLGGRRSVLNHMGPGEILGEIALLDNGTRSADAVAGTKLRMLALSRATIVRFLTSRPDTTMALIAGLCGRVREAVGMFELQTQINARARVARCLTIMASKWGAEDESGDIRMEVTLSQSDIGEISGLARENVNRQIKSMVEDGILRMEGRTMVVTDLEALEELCDE